MALDYSSRMWEIRGGMCDYPRAINRQKSQRGETSLIWRADSRNAPSRYDVCQKDDALLKRQQ